MNSRRVVRFAGIFDKQLPIARHVIISPTNTDHVFEAVLARDTLIHVIDNLAQPVAERAAWQFMQGLSGDSAAMTLASINPPMVLGVNKQQLNGSAMNLNQSSLIVYNLLSGNAKEVMPGSVGFTDVADVAKAHILAAQNPNAAGQRYLCSGTSATWAAVADILRRLYPSMPIPPNTHSAEQPCLDLANNKIRAELGMQFEPLDVTLKRQGDALISAGLLEG